jgi:hypothetical protein
MPQVIVIADDPSGRVMHSERVSPSDFETDHFRAQLAERVAWAVEDADCEAASDGASQPAQAAGSEGATPAPAHAV